MLIVIDPGHGGKDPGAMENGLIEKDLTMFLALRIEERLDNYECNAEIFQLPNVTAQEDMQSVVDSANEKRADFFLSVHINSVNDPAVKGFESFIHPNKTGDKKVQAAIHDAVSEYVSEHDIPDRDMKQANFKVLRETKMPAVLLECAFLSSSHDAERLRSIQFLDKLANAITWGMVQAFGLKPKTDKAVLQEQCLKLDMELRRLRQGISNAATTLAALMG